MTRSDRARLNLDVLDSRVTLADGFLQPIDCCVPLRSREFLLELHIHREERHYFINGKKR